MIERHVQVVERHQIVGGRNLTAADGQDRQCPSVVTSSWLLWRMQSSGTVIDKVLGL